MTSAKTRLGGVAAATLLLSLTACSTSPSTSDGGSDAVGASSVKVGVIASTTGPTAAYGQAYVAGLEAGIACLTDDGVVDGTKIVLDIKDDGGDAAAATAAATELIGDGVNVIAGGLTSDIALQLATIAEQNQILLVGVAAASDAITGVNEYTFRSGRQATQDVLAASTLLEEATNDNVIVLAQDSAYGQSNVDAVTAVMSAEGASVTSVLVPAGANEFTPFIQQVKNADPGLVYVAWAGADAAAVFAAVEQQDLTKLAPVVTLLNNRASYGGFGNDPQVTFVAHFFEGASETAEYKCLAEQVGADTLDLTSSDGFVAAQQIVRAVVEGDSTDVPSMIAALEGYEFTSPKGESTIRASDHALLQPMFTARLTNTDGTLLPERLGTIEASVTAPEEK